MKKWKLPLVPPLLFAGVLLILLPIFTLMTLDRLNRQKEFFTQRLMGKGISLIRTFEAGTRTGMFTMRWGGQRIQAMLYETSLQPEVLYLMITSRDGKILAHSDASKVGQVFEGMPEIENMGEDVSQVWHRVRQYEDLQQSFEVYKRFVPIRTIGMGGGMRERMDGRMHGGLRRGMHMRVFPVPDATPPSGSDRALPEKKDWSQAYAGSIDGSSPGKTEHYIFAGLSMEKERYARKRFVKNTIWRGILFFMLGCAGMVALFAFQAYRAARDSLNRVQAFSDNVIHHMPSGLVTIQADLQVSNMNQAAKDILGKSVDHPYPQWVELMRQIKRTRQTISREMHLDVQEGETVLLDITASPIIDKEDAVTGFLFLFKDMTQVKELKKQVETNKRLAAIGKLAAGVAHEIRNPLSSIKGFATYFGKRYKNNETDRQTAQVMVNEVERINQSITQLLEFAKPMAIEKKQVNIQEMMDHSLKLVQYDLDQKKIQARVRVDTQAKEIYTDGGRVNQVLLNLYINAVQAMDSNGQLDVRVRDGDAEGWIDIEVKDSGCGIDEEAIDVIFDPYFTTRPKGTGLGLSIVHRIVENLSGHIRVESKKDQGACFIISLPVAVPVSEEVADEALGLTEDPAMDKEGPV